MGEISVDNKCEVVDEDNESIRDCVKLLDFALLDLDFASNNLNLSTPTGSQNPSLSAPTAPDGSHNPSLSTPTGPDSSQNPSLSAPTGSPNLNSSTPASSSVATKQLLCMNGRKATCFTTLTQDQNRETLGKPAFLGRDDDRNDSSVRKSSDDFEWERLFDLYVLYPTTIIFMT